MGVKAEAKYDTAANDTPAHRCDPGSPISDIHNERVWLGEEKEQQADGYSGSDAKDDAQTDGKPVLLEGMEPSLRKHHIKETNASAQSPSPETATSEVFHCGNLGKKKYKKSRNRHQMKL